MIGRIAIVATGLLCLIGGLVAVGLVATAVLIAFEGLTGVCIVGGTFLVLGAVLLSKRPRRTL